MNGLNYLTQLEKIDNAEKEMAKGLAALPSYDAPEPPIDPADLDDDDSDDENTEGGETKTNTDIPGEDEIDKLNRLSATEVVNAYSVFVNSIAVEGYEYKNAEYEEDLRDDRSIKRGMLKNMKELSIELKNQILSEIDEITSKLEKFDERRKHLKEVAQISKEKREQAAKLLGEIWKIKGVQVNPMWGLLLIALVPVINAIMIIFLDGKKFKLG
jgi:hypothetical protein